MYRIFCWLGCCLRCSVYETADGIGGKCLDCGKVHGWVTRAELRAYCDREARAALTPKDPAHG